MKQQVDNVCNVVVGNKTFGSLLKGVVVSYMFSIILFLILSIFLCNTDFPEKYTDKTVTVITFTSILLAGFITARKASSRGWLYGILAGGLYMVILFIIDCIFIRDFVFSKNLLYMFMTGLGFGFFGGIIGINLKKKTKLKTNTK